MARKVIYDVHEDYEQTLLSKTWLKWWLRKPASLLWWRFEKTSCRLFDAVLTRDSELCRKFPAGKTVSIGNFPLSTPWQPATRANGTIGSESFTWAGSAKSGEFAKSSRP